MEKNYISDVLEIGTYGKWVHGEKVIISAPTGTGKTTFILKKLLPYCKSLDKKMLILCNRRLLSQQYDFELVDIYEWYAEMREDVDVMTYQYLSGQLCEGNGIEGMMREYDVVVCDEVHYFYNDVDFNAKGTYVLLQAIIAASFFKSIVMITATLEETLPIIENTFNKFQEWFLKKELVFPGFEKYGFKNQILDFQKWSNFEHFHCFYVEDAETLADKIVSSDKKTVIFIDDKQKAENFKKSMLQKKKLVEKDVYILNANVLEERMNDEVIQNLTLVHKIVPKVLITTSVLDNGVSIHDEEVGNVVIATESKVSFLQMK